MKDNAFITTKAYWKSRTFWGAVGLLLLVVWNNISRAINLEPVTDVEGTQETFVNLIVPIVEGVAALIAFIVTMIGRKGATQPIGLTSGKLIDLRK